MQPGLEGMLPISQGKFAGLQRSAVKWPNSVKQCAAICNSLNLANKEKVVGDEADLAAFKACEARFLVSWDCRFVLFLVSTTCHSLHCSSKLGLICLILQMLDFADA